MNQPLHRPYPARAPPRPFRSRARFLPVRGGRRRAGGPGDGTVRVHSRPGATQQRALEQRFDAALDPNDLRDWMKTLSAEANHVGSPHDKANAEMVRDLFRQWGWDAKIEVFEVLYPTLKSHTLELVGPTRFIASLAEDAIEGDATSTRTDGLPPYNVYGADGDVTAELVYLNYGMPQDYEDLARRGIEVKGKIVITRYGGGWRGLKPKLAQDHGAVGCIIYSDPQDDGYAAGRRLSEGRLPAGQQSAARLGAGHGAVPGRPAHPGVGATKGAKRLALKDAKTILKIPGAADLLWRCPAVSRRPRRSGRPRALARQLADHLPHGAGAGEGASDDQLRLEPEAAVRRDRADTRARRQPDEWVVRGNHRDGWVFGAWDPLSGHVAMLAEAKASARCSRAAGSRGARWSTRAGTARSPGCSVRPNGRRSMRRN